MCNKTPNIFSIVCMPVTALISGWERDYYIFSMCRYAQSCAFISVIELPRIPAYYPKEINELIEVLQDLNSDQLKLIRQVAEEFNKKK